MARLRRVDCAGPGIERVRRGRGFSSRSADGEKVADEATLARISDLVIPPAWSDVWICPFPNGHIQAVGTDAAGRRQYRYHDDWRVQRDAEKHRRVLSFAWRRPSACSISGSSGSAGSPTPRRTAATDSPRCAAGTSP